MTTSTAKQSDAPTTATLGKEGAPCTECGTPLAADQRYCLNCGHRRGEPRVDYQRHLLSGDEAAAANGRAAPAPAAGRAWNPLVAVGLIALLGIMLLVGVLIGMEDSDDEQTTTGTAPAQTPTA
ncbi:MAG: zinc ribbon domain-containing protein, partial [Solirubrobacterales bacterium]